jgi:RNA polymerase sigma-70 factor (ECF subfamily)
MVMVNSLMVDYATAQASITSSDEDQWVSAAQNGDLEAFNRLVVLYQDRIYNLALRLLGDEDSAADITQDAFLSAYRNLANFHHGLFRAWLYRIATNACYDELRRRKRRPVISLEYEDEAEERLLEPYDIEDDNKSPEKEYEQHELAQTIQHALNRLNPDQRAVVVLIDLQEFDYQEAAQILGVPIGTIKSRLVRARLQLRELLRAG